jgi:hypothetical protein
MRPHRAPVLLVLAALSACSLFGSHTQDTDLTAAVLFSPNGEPLSGGPLGHPPCAEAMGRWFDRVDASHDGAISLEEYLGDARRQFTAMDLDHDGVVTPAELSQYRQPYASSPPPQPEARDSDTSTRRGREDRIPHNSSDLADPVMAADVNLRNQVTLSDFLAYARRQFVALDIGKHGRLVRADALSFCAAPG